LRLLTRPVWLAQVGFLYLRYVADPRSLWNWFEEFLRDTEARSLTLSQAPRLKSDTLQSSQEIAPSPNGKTVPLGLFVRELLLDQFYFETIFPRIPEQVSRQIKDGLARLGFATAAVGCAGLGGSRRGGGDGRPPSVKAALSVSLGQRAPHVAGGREDGRGLANVDPGKERRQREERERAERAGGGGAVREAPPPRRSPPRDAPRRSRSPPRRRSRSPERRRSRSRSREHRKHHSHKRRSRSRDRRDRSRSRERRRSRSRERSRGGGDDGRSARDVFRSAPVPRTAVDALKDRY
jgi:pre-mRNA-splicing factor 38B